MPSLTEAAVLDALKAVRDPDLNRDIVSLKFIKNLGIDGGRVAFAIELTTPACPVKDQMRDQARAAVVAALPGVTEVDIEMTAQVRATATADGQQGAGAGREEHHRRRRRQGRRRQDDRRREPRHCVEPGRRPRGDDRRRHLRPQRADHARRADAADDRRPEDRAGGAVRHPARLDGVPDRRRCAGDLARADAARRDAAVLPRGPLGSASTT